VTPSHTLRPQQSPAPAARARRVRFSAARSDGIDSRLALGQLLAAMDGRGVPAREFRLLLFLSQYGSATVPDLARRLDISGGRTRRAARRLAMRGLLQRRYVETTQQTLYSITDSGLATLLPLLSASGRAHR
jgi:DNA-binding MarR family transcriptional regulator